MLEICRNALKEAKKLPETPSTYKFLSTDGDSAASTGLQHVLNLNPAMSAVIPTESSFRNSIENPTSIFKFHQTHSSFKAGTKELSSFMNNSLIAS